MSLRIAAPKPRYLVFFDDGSAPQTASTPFFLDDDGLFSAPRPAPALLAAQPIAADESIGFAGAIAILDEDGVVIARALLQVIAPQPLSDDSALSFIYFDDDGQALPVCPPILAPKAQVFFDDEAGVFNAPLTIVDEDGQLLSSVAQLAARLQPLAFDEASAFSAVLSVLDEDGQLVAYIKAAAVSRQPFCDTDELAPPSVSFGIDDDAFIFARTVAAAIQFRIFADDEQLLGKAGPVDEDFFILKAVPRPPFFLPIYDSGDRTSPVQPITICAHARTIEALQDSRQSRPFGQFRILCEFGSLSREVQATHEPTSIDALAAPRKLS